MEVTDTQIQAQSPPPAILFRPGDPVYVPTLSDIFTTEPDQFVAQYTDIAAVNLACAEGLASTQHIDIPKYLLLLDTMAAVIRQRVEKTWRLFKLKPGEFKHSENVFRIMTMEHVLRIVFGVKYDPAIAEMYHAGKSWITKDSSQTFIHGILSDKRTGTCSSLPVFSIAVGRRCGYPLVLTCVPTHSLYRWHDAQENFNYQHTESGGDIRADEYFHSWPHLWTEEWHVLNTRTKYWLYSMMAKREVAKFLCHRALCLRDERRYPEALEAIQVAERFDPLNPACAEIGYDTAQKIRRNDFMPVFCLPRQSQKEIA